MVSGGILQDCNSVLWQNHVPNPRGLGNGGDGGRGDLGCPNEAGKFNNSAPWFCGEGTRFGVSSLVFASQFCCSALEQDAVPLFP